jgi:hypothetical protein
MFGAPFRIKLRVLILLKYRHNFHHTGPDYKGEFHLGRPPHNEKRPSASGGRMLTELFEAGFEISNAVQVSPTIELQACN